MLKRLRAVDKRFSVSVERGKGSHRMVVLTTEDSVTHYPFPCYNDGAEINRRYLRVFINKCYDELNLRNPEIVLEVHKQYVRAGAEIIETNTYGANRIKLRSFGIEDELRAINERGAALAREAAGDSVFVAGAIGPLGIRIEPYGPTALEEAREYFREQAAALRDAGVDLFVLETIANIAEI